MPCIVDFPIDSHDRPLPKLYRALYSNLLKWMDAAYPGLGDFIHDRPVRKPFTISALTQDRDGQWRWRVTLLEDDLWEPLWTGVQTVGVLNLNGHAWPVRWPEAQVVHRSYDALLTRVRRDYHIKVRFLSPTVLRAEEGRFLSPQPCLVFQSWLGQWNDFAPSHRRVSTEILEVIRSHVTVRAYKLRTERHDWGRDPIVGFLGWVSYEIAQGRELNQALVWQLNALANYAEFCGTGRKTSYGMGQTRRIRRGQ